MTSAVYSPDGKIKFRSTSIGATIEWDPDTKEYQILKESEKLVCSEYGPGKNEDIKLETDYNIIKFDGKELVNIPGLFIQGCSFKDLEPGSEISPENLEILKQYGGQFGVKGE